MPLKIQLKKRNLVILFADFVKNAFEMPDFSNHGLNILAISYNFLVFTHQVQNASSFK